MAESIYDPAFWATFPRRNTISSGSQTTHAITYDANDVPRLVAIESVQFGSWVILGMEKEYPPKILSVDVGNGGTVQEKTGIGRR